TVSKIGSTVIEGIGLVIVVLMLFLGSPRSALVVAVTIPLAVVSIFVLMNASHMSASMLSLGALDFGVIVDGAIVVTENILRRREAKPNEALTEDDIRSATSQVARPIFFATLIIITAYFPLFTLQRGEAALSYAAAAIAVVAVVVLGLRVGGDYLPDLDEGGLWLQVQMPSGLSLEAASDMASELRRAVREFPEVQNIVTQLGREDAAVDA